MKWALLTSLILISSTTHAELTVHDLRCEYQTNSWAIDDQTYPLAIDVPSPRLNWTLESTERNQRQTAYQIQVADTNGDLVWDTGKVKSEQSIQIAYNGKPLRYPNRYEWKVRVWDRDGKPTPWSKTASWAMGPMKDADWNAQWICKPKTESNKESTVLPIFRRSFEIEKRVKRATVHICGLGFYELRLNGEKVGDSTFDPGWTNYRRTCLYATYDVTCQLNQAKNVLGVMLGNGMYNVPGGRYVKFTGTFGEPKFILKLRVEYNDGSVSEIVSDDSWNCADGPIVFSCIFGGEDYDARCEQAGWDDAGFSDSDWQSAAVCEGPGGVLRSQGNTPINIIKELNPVKETTPNPGVRVFDLGQNFSGIPWIQVKGAKGSSIKITPAELIDGEGLANQSASGGPHTNTYTLSGEGVETWSPRFTYYGFRYLQIETSPDSNPPEILGVKGLFTRNSAEFSGRFECSDELYMKVYRLIDWAVGSNLQSVLTDCPHREKLGWLEVAHLMAPSIAFNYDVPRFYNKVVRDIRDSQLEDGMIPDIAPEYVVFNGGFRDSPEWGSAGVILPWFLYEWYGDERALSDSYESMKRYVEYLGSKSTNHIVSHGLGDWFDYVRGGQVGESRLTPKSLTATAMYYRDAVITAKTAALLGKNDEANQYKQLAEEIRQAFNRELFHEDTNLYATGSQTALSIPLVWDIVDSDRKKAVLQNLVDEVKKRDYLTAGDVGFRFLLRALADNGRSDLVYRLTHRTDEPGYGYQIQQGATSLTEAWDGRKVVSHNHCMLGHLQEWFRQDLLGIKRDPSEPAFKKIVIKPNLVGDVQSVKGAYKSPYGRIACAWSRREEFVSLQVSIPANTTATVYIPTSDGDFKEFNQVFDNSQIERIDGYAVVRVGSGDYHFESKYGK